MPHFWPKAFPIFKLRFVAIQLSFFLRTLHSQKPSCLSFEARQLLKQQFKLFPTHRQSWLVTPSHLKAPQQRAVNAVVAIVAGASSYFYHQFNCLISSLQPQRWGASRVVWQTSALESETYRIWAVGWLQAAQDGSSLTGFKRMLTVWTMWGLENNPISCDWVCQIGFTRSASAFTWHIPWLLQNFSNVYILE